MWYGFLKSYVISMEFLGLVLYFFKVENELSVWKERCLFSWFFFNFSYVMVKFNVGNVCIF